MIDYLVDIWEIQKREAEESEQLIRHRQSTCEYCGAASESEHEENCDYAPCEDCGELLDECECDD